MQSETEDNDSYDTADTLTSGTEVVGQLSSRSVTDVSQFCLCGPQRDAQALRLGSAYKATNSCPRSL